MALSIKFYSWNVAIIADKLVDVPIIKPAKPKRAITVFLAIIVTFAVVDFCCFRNTHVSITAGKKSPSDDKHNAPNNEINKSSFGIATANRTKTRRWKMEMIRERIALLLKWISLAYKWW